MYKALYRAYRPETFEQLLGQEHIVRILKNQLKSDTVSHAYLFCGTRGTGKTTTARLLAKGLNCLCEGERPCGECSACEAIRDGNFIDVVEIDAASNRGIDEVRELRESVNYPPMVGRKKIYIIDEVHMLTTEAFNALLKTLEEPPDYVVFILATTEANRLPATILSRCMRLDFRRIPERIIADGMKQICREMDIDVTDEAIRIIAANADGSVRDGLSILDQCITGASGTVDTKDVLDYLGASGEDVLVELTGHVIRGRAGEAINCLAQMLDDGKDVRQLFRDWIQHYRNLMMTRFIRDPQDVVDLSTENIDRLREQAMTMEPEEITRGIMELSKAMNEARWSPQPRILLELCAVTLSSAGGQLKTPAPLRAAASPEKSPVRRTAEAGPEPAETRDTAEPKPEPAETQDAAEAKPEPAETQDAAKPEPVKTQDAAKPETSTATEKDLLDLWNDVFAAGSDNKGSMYLIRRNSMLVKMDEHTFTLEVSGEMNRKHIERNRKMIEDLMEEKTGHRRMMEILLKTRDTDEVSVEEAAEQASSVIGVPVEIK